MRVCVVFKLRSGNLCGRVGWHMREGYVCVAVGVVVACVRSCDVDCAWFVVDVCGLLFFCLLLFVCLCVGV